MKAIIVILVSFFSFTLTAQDSLEVINVMTKTKIKRALTTTEQAIHNAYRTADSIRYVNAQLAAANNLAYLLKLDSIVSPVIGRLDTIGQSNLQITNIINRAVATSQIYDSVGVWRWSASAAILNP